MTPFFSIIVPTYNRATLLQKGIESVRAQRFSNWELLIIDDGSDDATAQIVAEFSDERIRYYFQEKGERSQARNRGVQRSRAPYLCFLDDDDYWLPNYLQHFYEAIQSGAQKTILRTGFYYAFGTKLRKGRQYHSWSYRHPISFVLQEMCGVWTLCIPRDFLLEHSFPDFPHWQDTHLILRLLANYPFRQLPEFQYVYVQHEQMGTQQIFASDEAIEARLQLNLMAIDHFFEHHQGESARYFTARTHRWLISRKLLNYATAALVRGNVSKAKTLWKRSLAKGMFWRHWRLYLVYLKHFVQQRWRRN
ncbi:MAG: glycosyltransferase family 2 protein [Bacteroidota bacterium]